MRRSPIVAHEIESVPNQSCDRILFGDFKISFVKEYVLSPVRKPGYDGIEHWR